MVSSLNGGNIKTTTFTVPIGRAPPGYTQTAQKLILFSDALSNGSSVLLGGYESEYVEIYFTVDRVETLHHHIKSPATITKADSGKSGTGSFT